MAACSLAAWSWAGRLFGRPDKVWRAARRLQQKLNQRTLTRTVLPAHVLGPLGGCDPTAPRAPMLPLGTSGHLRIIAVPLFPCSSRPVRIGTSARQ